MALTAGETEQLKEWVVKKLADHESNADPDILADYVLALVSTTGATESSKETYVTNFTDFLASNTTAFVDELLLAISTKSFDPLRPPPKPVAPKSQPVTRSSDGQPRKPNESRKRAYRDWDREPKSDGYDPTQTQSHFHEQRAMKQPRRGSGRKDFRGTMQPPPLLQMPAQLPAPDSEQALAAFMAMQQAMGFGSSVPHFSSFLKAGVFPPQPPRQRCRDYDTKGFCAGGASCPHEHGDDPYIVPGLGEEYDPTDPNIFKLPSSFGLQPQGNDRGRGRRRGRRSANGRGDRNNRVAPFEVERNDHLTNTSIVVERIPADKYNEDAIRDFFSAFGSIRKITIASQRNRVVVNFDHHAAARAAYKSPKAVFDNRFVKVWLPRMEDGLEDGEPSSEATQEPALDLEAIAQQQEEAQRKYEQRKSQLEDHEKQRRDLDEKLHDLGEQRQSIVSRMTRDRRSSSPPAIMTARTQARESEQTRALKAQLAQLKEEAKSLGIDPEAVTNGYHPAESYRGRGGHRARGRGRERGSYRGWGGFATHAGGVMRLDNRPKTLAVTFTEGDFDKHQEALCQFLLLNNLDSATLRKHPNDDTTALLAFQHRYQGEIFMQAVTSSEAPRFGKVELSWFKAESPAGGDANGHAEKTTPEDETMDDNEAMPTITNGNAEEIAEEEDFDRWN